MFGASHAAVLAMHIPDNFISPSTSALFWAVMIPVWALCLRSVIRHSTAENMAYLGAGAAFSFLIMMFNVPTPGGTTVHGVGGALIALLLGPQYATVAISVALLLQALLFGDGGLLTLGANCFNMAFALPFCAYGIFMLLRKVLRAGWKDRVAEFVSAYVGIVLAAFCVAIELGMQPLLFRAPDGQALYFPFTFNVTIPAMVIPHLVAAGVVEGFVAVMVIEFVRRTSPEMIAWEPSGANIVESASSQQSGSDGLDYSDGLGNSDDSDDSGNAAGSKAREYAWVALGVAAILSPVGLLAAGDAWGEWGAEGFAQATGLHYVPHYIAHGFSWNAMLPDYSMRGLPSAVGYILCAIIGVAVLIIVFRLLALAVDGRNPEVVAVSVSASRLSSAAVHAESASDPNHNSSRSGT
ncbi:cobalt transporter CbiM [Bifidobacterium tibiigranuli]|jgi:cobalt/nickel transport system permease protein|uniref:cobalt transporter CbiM n=1 Tax=Bifidobacterium tibiigranuli TaxID=2172043 RepID=UPI0026E95054|nr:cobalt transporter CbiM [Bifidobacterium tibiigranuli]MCI1649118.1 cobalt transporter CbiM [Bifidobacterium tibiigranuli]MCI2185536.1 cobalt transporter CbiM [Bifidobacterium tibiigranuli]MCI2203489.1 cobalt transporter CbiM [Bifidobacterium tibiigranuli]